MTGSLRRDGWTVADRVTAASYRFEIVEMDGRRVDRVMVVPVETTEP